MNSTLEEGRLRLKARWQVGAVPKIAAGVYTVRRRDALIYVGMAGRGETEVELAAKRGVPEAKPSIYGTLHWGIH